MKSCGFGAPSAGRSLPSVQQVRPAPGRHIVIDYAVVTEDRRHQQASAQHVLQVKIVTPDRPGIPASCHAAWGSVHVRPGGPYCTDMASGLHLSFGELGSHIHRFFIINPRDAVRKNCHAAGCAMRAVQKPVQVYITICRRSARKPRYRGSKNRNRKGQRKGRHAGFLPSTSKVARACRRPSAPGIAACPR